MKIKTFLGSTKALRKFSLEKDALNLSIVLNEEKCAKINQHDENIFFNLLFFRLNIYPRRIQTPEKKVLPRNKETFGSCQKETVTWYRCKQDCPKEQDLAQQWIFLWTHMHLLFQ